MYSYLFTGIIAGIASSILYISGTLGTSLALFLYFLAPLPLFITGLGWGAISAAVGAISGVIVSILLSGFSGGLVYFISIGLIPIIISYYALMSRSIEADGHKQPSGTGQRDWYPLGNLVLWIAGFATVITALFILFIMPSTSDLRIALEGLFRVILDQNPELKTRLGGENAIPQLVGVFIALLPVTLASYTFTTIMANLWLASKIISASGRAIRPAFVMNTISYPNLLPLILVGLLALTFLPGAIHVVALAGTTSLTLSFMLLGLLVIHAIIPKVAARAAFLGAFYITVFVLLKYAYIALALLGIAETFFNIRQRFSSPPPPGTPGTPGIPPPRDD